MTEPTTQPEALRLAVIIEWFNNNFCNDAAAELRRQHAEIERLKAELTAANQMCQKMVVAHGDVEAERDTLAANLDGIKHTHAEQVARLAADKERVSMLLGDAAVKVNTLAADNARMRAVLAEIAATEPVGKVVSSGPANLPVFQWLSADHSLRCNIGDKLFTRPMPAQDVNAERVPLSDAQAINAMWIARSKWMEESGIDTEGIRHDVPTLYAMLPYFRAAESAHGIGQGGKV